MLDAAWLDEALRTRLPRSAPRATLSLLPWSGAAGYPATTTGANALGLWACLRLGNTTTITVLVRPKALPQPRARAEAYLDGWLIAVDRVLNEATPHVLELAAPVNLVAPDALELARPKTAEDFTRQILAEKRLGKLIGDPAVAIRSLDAGR